MKHLVSGFTLVELAMVLGIMSIILAMASIGLSGSTTKASLDTTTQILIGYIKQQQMAALSGETEGRTVSDNYGIHISSNQYTLFHGNNYSATDSSNFNINLDDFLLSSTFANDNIIYNRITGEILNFQPGQNTITLKQNNYPLTKIITINKYGAIESISQI